MEEVESEIIPRYSYFPTNSSYNTDRSDILNLSVQLVHYFMVVYKNFEFKNFYDAEFVDILKALIKDTEEFNRFLKMVGLDIQMFLQFVVYISPTAFTSNLVKFIQKTYLNIEPPVKKKKKK